MQRATRTVGFPQLCEGEGDTEGTSVADAPSAPGVDPGNAVAEIVGDGAAAELAAPESDDEALGPTAVDGEGDGEASNSDWLPVAEPAVGVAVWLALRDAEVPGVDVADAEDPCEGVRVGLVEGVEADEGVKVDVTEAV